MLELILINIGNFILVMYFVNLRKYYHIITGDKLEITDILPLTVSQAHSENYFGRSILSASFSLISIPLTIYLYNRTGSYINLIHLTLSLISFFPLQSNADKEKLVIVFVPSVLSDYIHKLLVFIYVVLFSLICHILYIL